MRKIAVTINKGGVGKSTTAVNLAAGLALVGRKVLLIDMDTQGHPAKMLGLSPHSTLKELVLGERTFQEIMLEARPNLYLLPGGAALAALRQHIAFTKLRGEEVVARALRPLEQYFDYFIFDTSPGWDELNLNVLFSAEELMLPVQTSLLTMTSLVEFLQTCFAPVMEYRPNLRLQYVVPTFVDGRVGHSSDIYQELKTAYAPPVLCPPIRYNAALAEAPGHGKTIYEYAVKSRGAQDYAALVEHVLRGEANHG